MGTHVPRAPEAVRLVDRGPKRQRGDRANTRDGHQTTAKQAENLAIIVTHDENGGFWDPMAPPRGDRWGPGSRIPTVIASPYAKKGFVDHTVYDTTSILQFISKRFELQLLRGIRTQFGDLRNAFAFGR